MTWQPISTAPRDGTEFLAWTGKREVMNWPADCWPGQWVQRDGKWYGQGTMHMPTAWHPLPQPPENLA